MHKCDSNFALLIKLIICGCWTLQPALWKKITDQSTTENNAWKMMQKCDNERIIYHHCTENKHEFLKCRTTSEKYNHLDNDWFYKKGRIYIIEIKLIQDLMTITAIDMCEDDPRKIVDLRASTHLPLDKMTAVRRRHFQTHFHEWKFLHFDLKLIELCS